MLKCLAYQHTTYSSNLVLFPRTRGILLTSYLHYFVGLHQVCQKNSCSGLEGPPSGSQDANVLALYVVWGSNSCQICIKQHYICQYHQLILTSKSFKSEAFCLLLLFFYVFYVDHPLLRMVIFACELQLWTCISIILSVQPSSILNMNTFTGLVF